MYDEQQRPEHGPLSGFTVGVTAARRADELGALLQRRGATVVHAPALRIVPLADDGELLTATKELVENPPDVVVATTAIGFRGWVEAADGWGLGEELLARLRGIELLARAANGWLPADCNPPTPRHQCSPLTWDDSLGGLVMHGGETGHGGSQFHATRVLRFAGVNEQP